MTANATKDNFLRQIVENPDDDTPRLVYADWLEENGESERAEFIRVQCEKARLPRWHRQWEWLDQREWTLLARYADEWRAELPKIPDVVWGEFERGFVQEVRVVSPKILEREQETIQRAAPVRAADIMNPIAKEEWETAMPLPFIRALRLNDYYELEPMFHSPVVSTLEMLDLSSIPMEGHEFAAMGSSKQLQRLSTLILDECYMGDGNLGPFAESEHFREVRRLSMKGNKYGYHEDARIRPADVRLLANSANLGKLESLDLTGNEVDVESLGELLDSPHLRNLQELIVAENRILSDGLASYSLNFFEGGLSQLAAEATMRLGRLSLANNPIGDAGALWLAACNFCEELVDLDLSTCDITTKGIESLAGSPWFGNLGRLNLNNNSVGADGVFALINALDAKHLFALHLANCELDAEAVKLLADASCLQNLLTLDLSKSGADGKSLQSLLSSPKLARLRELHLADSGLHHSIAKVGELNLPGQLLRLSLGHNLFEDKGLEALFLRDVFSRLCELRLPGCKLSAKSIAILANAGLPKLGSLDLANNGLGEQGMKALANSPFARTLVELKLGENKIGDKGAKALAAGNWPWLKHLYVEANELTEKGLLAMSDSPGLSSVEAFFVRRNSVEWKTRSNLWQRFRFW